MKKHFTILLISCTLIFSFSARATTHTVTVQDFSFSPSTINVNVGDVIMWTWISGSHTTTSTSVPGGAASWGNAINSGSTSFSYTVTMAGTYNYECTIHPSLMTGSFTATGSVGIPTLETSASFLIGSSLTSNELQITYRLEKNSMVDVLLLDLNGKQVNKFASSNHNPGTYTETYSLASLSKGEYVLELRAGDIIASRKIMIQ